MKNLGTGREPSADPGLDPKPFSLGADLGGVFLGPYQMQEALGSGGQQLVAVNAQYTKKLVGFRLQEHRAWTSFNWKDDQFQLEGSPTLMTLPSKPL